MAANSTQLLDVSPPLRRKGARRMSEIPADVRRALNEGRIEAVTLVESLAVDGAELARNVFPALSLGRAAAIRRRLRGMGEAIHAALHTHARRKEALRALSAHASDTVRIWAAYAIAADPRPGLEARLRAARTFAADRATAVRECAWDSIRPYLAADLKQAIRLLKPWARHRDPNVRRTAIEATRPRGVWCAHIEALKRRPQQALPLLDMVKSDSSDYVRRSVANWLNDASKSCPDWVREVCDRWGSVSPCPETAWIVHHATRSLRKAARKDRLR